VLDLILDVSAAATYALELYMTRAPDYGILKIEVDGKVSPVEFYGLSLRVIGPTPCRWANSACRRASAKSAS